LIRRLTIMWIFNTVALFVATWLLSGLSYGSDWWALLVAGLVFTLVNSFLKPALTILSIPADHRHAGDLLSADQRLHALPHTLDRSPIHDRELLVGPAGGDHRQHRQRDPAWCLRTPGTRRQRLNEVRAAVRLW
jgi:hypothetical protein